jgi:hypothetical protein
VSIRKLGIGGSATVLWVAIVGALVGALLWSASALAAAPVVSEEWVTNVSAEGATLHARLNPEGTAKYHFEYGTSSQYAYSSAQGTAEGTGPVNVEVHVQVGVSAAQEYHYRLVAAGEANDAEVAEGKDLTFTTPLAGGNFTLPDSRAWEMVSPVNKRGAAIQAITKEGGVIESAEDGSALTYVADGPFEPEPEGNPSFAESQQISERGTNGGWPTRDLATPHDHAIQQAPAGHLAEYNYFTPNLEEAILEQRPGTAKSLSSEASERTIYVREGVRKNGKPRYVPIVGDKDVPPGAEYEGEHYGRALGYIAASSNLEHIVLASAVPLLTDGKEGAPGYYEWNKNRPSAERLQPVSILPGGEWAEYSEVRIGNYNQNVRNAVSSDGSRVFWEAEYPEHHLYVRDTVTGVTTQIDAPQGVSTPVVAEDPRFQYATPDGTKVYFTDQQRLTPESTASNAAPELYEFNTVTGHLRDLTPDTHGATSESVQGSILGVTEDGEYIYLVADGVMAEKAVPGECKDETASPTGATCNLYRVHVTASEVTYETIAVLSSEDEHDWAAQPGSAGEFVQVTSRMSSNGDYLAFMSDRNLTGYDNTDVNEEEDVPGEGKKHADEEVFLYDAGTNHLVCASCNPTGARPHGVYDKYEAGEGLGLLVDRPRTWENRWISGSVPGWTSYSEHGAQYQSRYLSNQGRLFFNASDGLVPADSNGKEDVYEYEPEGLGPVGPSDARCEQARTSASEVFKPERSFTNAEGGGGHEGAGCVALISSGTSATESAFLDASATGPGGEEGEDVFFLTASPLVSQDVDSAYDVYDAHECSSVRPCPSPPVALPPCTTAESCRVAPAPQPAIFGAPSTQTLTGPGNPAPAVAPAVVKPKALTNAQKLAAALKGCAKDRVKRKRVACEEQARKRYPVAKKAKKQQAKTHTSSKRGGKS